MPRVKTFAAGGSVTAADLNNLQDDYEQLLSGYRHGPSNLYTANGSDVSIAAGTLGQHFTFDFAGLSLATSPRTTRLRLSATLFSNAVSAGAGTRLTIGVAPVIAYGGSSSPTSSLGAAVPGSTVVFGPSIPVSSTSARLVTADFAPPVGAGPYVFTYAFDSLTGTGMGSQVHVQLWFRHI